MGRSDQQLGFAKDVRSWLGSPLGEIIMAQLEALTIQAPIFPAGNRNPQGPADESLYAAFRAGQNDIVFQLKREIALGREGK